MHFHQEKVLPFVSYQRLLSFLVDDTDRALLGALVSATTLSGGGAGKESLALVLARIFEARSASAASSGGGGAPAMIAWVSAREIESTPDPNIIFRGNTLATKLVGWLVGCVSE
jgi:hypothetical protein